MPNSVKYKVFIAFLVHIGCSKISQKGSHEKYKKEGLTRPIIVPKKDMVYPTVISSNLKTLGFSYQEFLDIITKNNLK
jgi:predicted RNA binding protein YcfA (HicA-like mRNA interferase family)